MIPPPHDFDSPPHLTSYGKVRRAGTYREPPLGKERTSNFQSLDNVAHDINYRECMEVKGDCFFFFAWIERGGP
jgi:hypothetical protein